MRVRSILAGLGQNLQSYATIECVWGVEESVITGPHAGLYPLPWLTPGESNALPDVTLVLPFVWILTNV